MFVLKMCQRLWQHRPHSRRRSLQLEPLDSRITPAELLKSLVYYGWPSVINGANNNIAAAAAEYTSYSLVVLGGGLEESTGPNAHPDHSRTIQIIAHPSVSQVHFYGYVPIGNVGGGGLSDAVIADKITKWQAMGVAGILLDEFGYDYNVTRTRQNLAVSHAHSLGLKVIANGWIPSDVFSPNVHAMNPSGTPTQLNSGDFYMAESYQVNEGNLVDAGFWEGKRQAIDEYRKLIGFGVIGLTTSTEANGYTTNELNYAVASARVEGFTSLAIGEPGFSASGAFNGVVNHRTLAPANTEAPLVVTGLGTATTVRVEPSAGVGSANNILRNGSLLATIPLDRAIQITGGTGTLTVEANTGNTFGPLTVMGSSGPDLLQGGLANDTINGGAGNDTMYGFGGNDHLSGGIGNDVFFGGINDDQFAAGEGADTIDGGPGRNDHLTDREVSDVSTNVENFTDMQFPALSVSNAIATEGNPTVDLGALRTSGRQIIDKLGRNVRLSGVNWYGFETPELAPTGLNIRSYQSHLEQMRDAGFNTIRLPFAVATFDPGRMPTNINYTLNPSLQGKTPLQVMDAIIAHAQTLHMRVILDCHRSDLGTTGPNESGLWYTPTYTEARWMNALKMLASRYRNVPTVTGIDLMNEPHNLYNASGQLVRLTTWGDNNPATDWRLAATKAGNAVLAANPNLLIIVEGIESTPETGWNWWGSNLSRAVKYPITLNVANRLVYSVHDYPPSVYAQPWLQNMAQLPQHWTKHWGYLFAQNKFPILVGEFGSKLATAADREWLTRLTNYLDGDLNGDGRSDLNRGEVGMSHTYWTWFGSEGDTGGLLAPDGFTLQTDKLTAIKKLQTPWPGATTSNTLTFTVSLSKAAETNVVANLSTFAGTANSADFTPRTLSVTFLPGETQKNVSVPITGDTTAEAAETMTLRVLSATGGNVIIANGTGTGTILNDDGTAPAVKVTPLIKTSWGTGFDAQVSVVNLSTKPITDWVMEFDAPFDITYIWGAEIVSHVGNHYVIKAAPTTAYIGANSQIDWGFVAGPIPGVLQLANMVLRGTTV